MIYAATALLLGNTLVTVICLYKLQSTLLVMQHIAEYLTEEKSEQIGFRSETAPPNGLEDEYVDHEYQAPDPLVYDRKRGNV